MSADSKKIKKILYKIQYLKAEKDEASELLEEYITSFLEEVESIAYENEKTNELYGRNANDHDVDLSSLSESASDKESDEKEESGSSLPECIKKIYKKIVIIVHPDKYHSSDLSDEKQKEYIDIYKKVSSAANEGDIIEVLCAALELGVDVSNIDSDAIEAIENSCNNIQVVVLEMKNTYPWMWANAAENEHKKEIINHYLKNRK
jgi:hypothetical protein